MEEEARIIFRKLEEDPRNPEYNYKLGKLFMKNGNLMSAIKYFENVVEIEPDFRDAKELLERLKKDFDN